MHRCSGPDSIDGVFARIGRPAPAAVASVAVAHSKKGVLLMSSAVLERRGAFATGAAPAFPGAAPAPAPTQNVCVVPRCEFKFEKCKGGFRISCSCENAAACQAL